MSNLRARVEGVYKIPKAHLVVLETEKIDEVLPIFISEDQARSIQIGAFQKPISRPLTHDLLLKIIEDLDFRVEKVTIDDLIGNTFVAELRLVREDTLFPYDVRPSDAIAIAVRTDAQILVSETVMENAGEKKDELFDTSR